MFDSCTEMQSRIEININKLWTTDGSRANMSREMIEEIETQIEKQKLTATPPFFLVGRPRHDIFVSKRDLFHMNLEVQNDIFTSETLVFRFEFT